MTAVLSPADVSAKKYIDAKDCAARSVYRGVTGYALSIRDAAIASTSSAGSGPWSLSSLEAWRPPVAPRFVK